MNSLSTLHEYNKHAQFYNETLLQFALSIRLFSTFIPRYSSLDASNNFAFCIFVLLLFIVLQQQNGMMLVHFVNRENASYLLRRINAGKSILWFLYCTKIVYTIMMKISELMIYSNLVDASDGFFSSVF